MFVQINNFSNHFFFLFLQINNLATDLSAAGPAVLLPRRDHVHHCAPQGGQDLRLCSQAEPHHAARLVVEDRQTRSLALAAFQS